MLNNSILSFEFPIYGAESSSGKVAPSAQEPPLKDRIRALRQLKAGWYYGAGVVPSQENIERAVALGSYLSMLGVSDFSVFPGEGGEIQLVGDCDEYTVELTVEKDGDVTLAIERSDEEVWPARKMSADQAKKTIKRILGVPWHYSGLFIRATTTESAAGLLPLDFKIRVFQAEGFPSSARSVSRRQVFQSVDILDLITRTRRENLLSSGGFRPKCLGKTAS